MYLDKCTTSGKYARCLLRESYRENGKVKHRTVGNLSRCTAEEITAVKLALRHKGNLRALVSVKDEISTEQGLSVGAVWLLYDLAGRLGIRRSLGKSRAGRLALWQVLARVIDQGSRLSAVRLATSHAACDILGIEAFNEDDLYENLDWLYARQMLIEQQLFREVHEEKPPRIFLYDVTSVYLEGTENELAAFGYNRDGKRGKLQIVVGLLCDEEGIPLSIEVFEGNTQDPATVGSQIRKVAERFGGADVTFVGDRGMLKSRQIQDLFDKQFHYITAITKPQVEKLISEQILQMNLFDQDLAEIETEEGLRYILRRNPLRAAEVKATRRNKLLSVQKEMTKQNAYLAEHTRAKPQVALRKVQDKCNRLKLSSWVSILCTDRCIELKEDPNALAEAEKLDGCYVLKTDLTVQQASKEVVHDRYKDLALVEWAFRISKTVQLEARPVFVRTSEHTRAHLLVVMLAYRIAKYLADSWVSLNVTVQEGINQLATLCAETLLCSGKPCCQTIPKPRKELHELLQAAKVRLPQALPSKGVKVATRKKLPENRKPRN